MFAAFAILAAVAAECTPPKANEPVALLVVSRDPALAKSAPAVERAIRAAAAGSIVLLPPEATARALTIEGGAEEREAAMIDARVVIGRAEDKFRELDDEEALSLLAKAIARLSSVHQEPGAIGMLANAHFLAGAIYLARGRPDAARQRLQRALDLEPLLAPPRDRFAPEVIAELAAVRAEVRTSGRLVVRTPDLVANVFVDGRAAGKTPLELDSVHTGNHLLRVAAPGRLSHVETIQISPTEDLVREVKLARDPELEKIAAIDRGGRVDEALALIARRAGARRTLLATMALSESLTKSGTATIGVDLHLLGASTAYAPTLDKTELTGALHKSITCGGPAAQRDSILAPSSFGMTAARLSAPAPVPEPTPVWRRPWFWAVAAVAAIGVSSAFVVARTSGGPPDTVEVTLVPRP